MEYECESVEKIKVAFPSIKCIKYGENPTLCHCHSQFVYQFIECPNCLAHLCLQSMKYQTVKNKTSISEHNYCKFCNILYVSSAKLARTN